MLKSYIRPFVAAGVIATLLGVWTYQTLTGGNPDSMLTMVVLLTAIASIVFMYGKGTVTTSLEVLERLREGGSSED